ncbi:MAG: ribosome maturation factor RimP [Bacilli bacterium]|nr:ribosome maturation factor RimP [Bacilli bacterium]
MTDIENEIRNLLEKPLADLGYEIYEISFRQGKQATLSIVVDRSEPIGLDDIVSVSEAISPILDEHDPIEGAYTLDVSSSGAEKRIALEKLDQYLGRYVNLHLTHPYKGENYLEGTLLKLSEEEAVLLIKDKSRKKEISFPRGDIDKARLAIEF